MNINYHIIPECYADTNLIETLVPPLKGNGYNHQMGCNKVALKMQNELKDSFALGIIDKDKRTIGYLSEFETIAKSKNLFLLKHKTKHHFVVQIHPAIEKFILEEASSIKIDMEEFHLSNNLEQMKQVTKKVTSKKEQRLSMLFKELVKKDAPQIKTLRNWIVYLRDTNFSADVEKLKNL